MDDTPNVLILTPAKNAVPYLDTYFAGLETLTYSAERLSLGLLESDSTDGTHDAIARRLDGFVPSYRRKQLWRHDFGFGIPPQYQRFVPAFQLRRRTVLAKSRNHLLFHALRDEDWVLWLDVDVCEYPADIVERLLATGKTILHPHCVREYGGPTFDRNAWRDKGRVQMDDMRGGPDLVRLDAVGGSMLLIHADIHRDGLIFPPFLYGPGHRAARDTNDFLPDGVRGEIETEGLGLMAQDMGYQCWGLPNLEIRHVDA